MFNRYINQLHRVAARQWRSSRYRLILLVMRVAAWGSTWWAPREVLAWLQICARELQTALTATLAALLPHATHERTSLPDRHGSAFFAPVFDWPPRNAVRAPDGFTEKVMARVRALPSPAGLPAQLSLQRATSPRLRAPHPVPVLLASLAIALVLLLWGAVVALFNPGMGVLLVALLVNLLLALLDTVHLASELYNTATANAWTSVPLLVFLLGAMLLAWSLLARLIEMPVAEA